MRKLNTHGWDHLSGDNAEVVAARDEVLRQLRGVTEPDRSAWEKRLTSELDHPHFSVRLEIYLYQYFRERGWEIEIEPRLAGTCNRPDFVVNTNEDKMIVEAKTVLGAKSERQQDDRLMQLADDLGGKLNRTVFIHPVHGLPSSLPNRRIAAEIEDRASEVELLQEFWIEGKHQGQSYLLEVTVILEDKPTPIADVGATIGQAVDVDIGHPVRKAIRDKAKKYGEIDTPFVIAVWPKLPFHFSSSNDDLVALYGDEDWVGPNFSELRVYHRPNGVFTIKGEDCSHRYRHVSAVLFCHPDKTGSVRVYHNPFAKHSIGMDVFKGAAQCNIDLTTGKEQWLPQ